MKVRLTRRAVRDLRDVSTFILASNPAAADRVRNALQAFALLAAHPLAGRQLAGGRRRLALGRCPYVIFYRVDDPSQVVEIITIRHGARAPD